MITQSQAIQATFCRCTQCTCSYVHVRKQQNRLETANFGELSHDSDDGYGYANTLRSREMSKVLLVVRIHIEKAQVDSALRLLSKKQVNWGNRTLCSLLETNCFLGTIHCDTPTLWNSITVIKSEAWSAIILPCDIYYVAIPTSSDGNIYTLSWSCGGVESYSLFSRVVAQVRTCTWLQCTYMYTLLVHVHVFYHVQGEAKHWPYWITKRSAVGAA